MKSIQIGKLVFNKKAILLLTFCLFLNVVIIGALLAYKELAVKNISTILMLLLLLLPYFIYIKKIGSNIKEVD